MMMEVDGDDADDMETTAATATATASVTDSTWALFQKKYPSIKDHVDIIKRKHHELSNVGETKGRTVTSEELSESLFSEYFNASKDERRDKLDFLQYLNNPQIAIDALKILDGGNLFEYDEFHQSPYKDPLNKVQNLYDYIKKCDNEYDKHHMTKWNAPFITICQSSGWGKSRIVRQLSALIPVLYFSCQKDDSGYPERTITAIDFLRLKVGDRAGSPQTCLTNESHHRLVFAAQRYKIFWNDKRKTLLQGQESNEDAKEQFIEAVFNSHDFWIDLEKEWNKSYDLIKTTKGTKQQKENLAVVVVFDEFYGLLNDDDPKNYLILALRRSLGYTYKFALSNDVRLFGVFIGRSPKVEFFPILATYSSSAREFQGSELFDPYLLHGMKDVRYDANQDWLQNESIIGLGRPLWTTKSRDSTIEELQEFARLQLVAPPKSEYDSTSQASYQQDLAVVLCRLGLFFSMEASITSRLVEDHMAIVYAYDKRREAIKVSYTSEPILAFGAMKQWKKRGLCPLLKSTRTALIQGVVKDETHGEIAAMILLLKSLDELNAGLAWSNVQDFLENLALMNQQIKEDFRSIIPKESKLNFNHFVPWWGKFNHSDLRLLLSRRAACILQRHHGGEDLLIPFFARDGTDMTVGAILVEVMTGSEATDAFDVGKKFFVSPVFKHWSEEEQNIPIIRVVLELGLSRTEDKSSSIPMTNHVDQIEVRLTRDPTTPTEDDEAAFVMTSSNSQQEQQLFLPLSMKERKIQFLQVRGIASVPWMNEATYKAFNDLLDWKLGPATISAWSDGVDPACFWKAKSFLRGLTDDEADK